jgi:hypothetical protein
MMKRAIIGILILNFSYVLFGQEIEVKGIYAASNLKKFQNSFGCGIGYNGFVNPKTRIGFSLEYLYNCIPYENRYTPDADTTITIDKVRPNNHKIAVKFSCSFRILNKSKSLLFIGPEFGLILFIINEKFEQAKVTPAGLISYGYQGSHYFVKPTTSLGFLLEYELTEIIAHKISVSVSVHPELSGYGTFGMKGSSDPSLVGWLNAEIGFKYNFSRKENNK